MLLRIALSLSAALLTTAAIAEDAPANREIVVIGQSLKDTERAWQDCIARGCPPDQEIRAALAHAENQFITGDYRDAKTTINKTVGRNRKHGGQYPIEVSDLFRASSRISEHLGEADQFRLAVLDMRDTLREGLTEGDPRAMVAQIEVGDSRAKLGYPREAIRIYRDVAEKAFKAGQARVGTYADLRRYLLEYAVADESNYKADMDKALDGLQKMADGPPAGAEDFGLVAAVTLARLDRKAGNTDSTAAIVKRFADRGGANRPILLSAEPIKLPDTAGLDQKSGNVLAISQGNIEDRWIDVGFWVNANGLVSDAEVLRSSGNSRWSKLVIDSIASRIYAPLKSKGDAAAPGFYMIERYTFTARYMDEVTGTRIRQRSPIPRIERIDITPENYDQP
ncbi:MAG: energy transducer TonB, partial [Sphingomonadales bacterium]